MSNPNTENSNANAGITINNPIQEFDTDSSQPSSKVGSTPKKRSKNKEDDLNLIENISRLLASSDDITNEAVKSTVDHYINLQRIVENTNARKRLEKWAKWVISVYLIVIFLILIFAYIPFSESRNVLKMSDTVVITILSTTTVNILGLGFIILKGHFPQNGGDDCKK